MNGNVNIYVSNHLRQPLWKFLSTPKKECDPQVENCCSRTLWKVEKPGMNIWYDDAWLQFYKSVNVQRQKSELLCGGRRYENENREEAVSSWNMCGNLLKPMQVWLHHLKSGKQSMHPTEEVIFMVHEQYVWKVAFKVKNKAKLSLCCVCNCVLYISFRINIR